MDCSTLQFCNDGMHFFAGLARTVGKKNPLCSSCRTERNNGPNVFLLDCVEIGTTSSSTKRWRAVSKAGKSNNGTANYFGGRILKVTRDETIATIATPEENEHSFFLL